MKMNFIVTGDSFPYQYYLAVKTAQKTQKAEAKVWLMEGGIKDTRYLDLLHTEIGYLPKLNRKALIGKDEQFVRGHTKDYYMWKILKEEGGFYFDLDMIFLKDVIELLGDKEMLLSREYEVDGDWYSWGANLMGAKKGSDIMTTMVDLCERAMENPAQMRWVTIGPELTTRAMKLFPSKIVGLPFPVGCGVSGTTLSKLYEEGEMDDVVRVVHLYGAAGRFVPGENRFEKIDSNFVHTSKTRIAKAIRSVLTEEEYNPKLEGSMFGKKEQVAQVAEVVSQRKKYRFHLLGLVHLPCSQKYMSCAFTQKNHKMARMLLSLGHEVFYYGCEGSDVPCTEFVQTHTLKDVCEAWGDGDNRFEIGYDWQNTDFRHDFNMERKPVTLKFNANVIEHINKIKKPDDFLLCTQGYYQKPISDGVKLFLTCEPGIGYRGSVKGNYKAFESAYIMNFSYGSFAPYECINGSYYDRVIPNYFDPDDVEFSEKKEDYYFFIGRMIKRKGIMTAYLACEALGKKLIIAGQGGVVLPDGTLTATWLPDFSIPKGHWEYVGFVDGQRRKDLFKHAIATFTPTEYLECFAGTHVESMLHGTPVITTDFGVYSGDTFADGVHGFKCNTLDDFVYAAKNAHKLDPKVIRKWGERYLMDNVRWEYQKWFEDLYQVYLSAINPGTKGWHHIRTEEPEWRKVKYK